MLSSSDNKAQSESHNITKNRNNAIKAEVSKLRIIFVIAPMVINLTPCERARNYDNDRRRS